MRILFLTPGYPPLFGGGERYAERLATHLAKHGHEITVVTSCAKRLAAFYQGSEEKTAILEEANGVRIVRWPIRPFRGGRVALLGWRKAMILLSALGGPRCEGFLERMAQCIPPIEIAEALLEPLGPFDLVHAFNLSWEYPALVGWHYARAKGLPYVLTPFLHIGQGLHSRVAHNTTMHHQRRLIREAEAVLALTSLEKVALEALGAKASRIHVVGSGVDDPPPPGAIQKARQETEKLALPRPFALYIGRLERDKGAFLAIEAVRRVNHFASLGLILVGEKTSPFERYWRRLPASARERIRVLGNVSEALKHALLEECAMLLLPSEVESFGLVILEAWSHKKPVIAARAGGIPGVVRDGENGILFQPGRVESLCDAICGLLEDPALALRLGEAGWVSLSAFTWASVYERVLAAYHAAIEARGG